MCYVLSHGRMLTFNTINTLGDDLGPDRLAGPKALDPNIAENQPFDCTIFVWKS